MTTEWMATTWREALARTLRGAATDYESEVGGGGESGDESGYTMLVLNLQLASYVLCHATLGASPSWVAE